MRQLGESGGMLPQKNFKLKGFAGAFWSGFDTSELRVQLTSAHTCALTARASRIDSRKQRHGDGAKKERETLLEPRPPTRSTDGYECPIRGVWTFLMTHNERFRCIDYHV